VTITIVKDMDRLCLNAQFSAITTIQQLGLCLISVVFRW